jgi:hypothetical protein
VACLALVANIVLSSPAGAIEWCEPRTANEAYDAILEAAADGSDLDVEARELAEDRRADGEFDTDETREDLHDLAVEHDYLFDCAARAYRYAPDESSDEPGDFDADDDSDDADEDAEDAADDAEDEADEDEADEDEDEDSPAASSPTTAPATRTAPPAARPAPARPATPAPATSYRPTPQPAPAASASGSGSYAYSYNYSYPNKWAPTATPAPVKTAPGPTQITSAPLIKSMPTPVAAVSSGTETTRRVSNGADRRLFLVPAALGIALGVECMKRWAQRRRRF